jgi:hypothetical protein
VELLDLFLFFGDRVLLCSPGWPVACNTLASASQECWDYRPSPPCLALWSFLKDLGPIRTILWSLLSPHHSSSLPWDSDVKRAGSLTSCSYCATSCFQIGELICWKFTKGNSLILESTKNLSVVTQLNFGGS